MKGITAEARSAPRPILGAALAGVALLSLGGAACRRSAAVELCGEVLGDDGSAVAGAIVRGGAGSEARTDRDGRFCVAAEPSRAAVTASAEGFCPAPPRAQDGEWTRIVFERQLVVAPVYQVGFDEQVQLRTELRCPLPGPVTFRWDQLEGPSLVDRAEGWSGPRLLFRTHPLAVRTARPDVLSLSPREAGHYLLRMTARGRDRVLRAEVEVTAASARAGLLSVPMDTDAYLDSGAGRPAGTWRLVSRPTDSRSRVLPVPTVDGTGGVVRARLDVTGLYEFVEERSGTRLIFEAGPWDTIPRDCDRVECHPSEQVEWAKTRHARALDDRLDQATPEPFGDRCLLCHTVGWDPGARTGGFDDIATDIGARVRDAWPGGAAALPRDLRRVANVWCIACHGPGRLPEHGKRPMVVRVGVCAQCHDAPPKYPRAAEWRTTKMSRPITDPARLGERCAGCHTAQGAVLRLRGRIVNAVPADLAEPVTCQVCHLAHTSEEHLLRRTGTVSTVSGVLFEAGKGATCLGCHQANGRADDAAVAARHLPEAPQTEVLFGTGAFSGKGRPYHVSRNLCVDCHMARCLDCHSDAERYRGGHTFRAMPTGERAPEDCDGDGQAAPIAEETKACLARLGAAIGAALAAVPGCEQARLGRDGERLVPVGAHGERLPGCEAEWLRPELEGLYRAAYDYTLIDRDGSLGAHNPPYVLEVLRKALGALETP